MKRKVLPLLVAAASITMAGGAIAGGPTVYGKVNVTLNKYDLEQLDAPVGASAEDEQDNWAMESNASRLGVKGDFDINDSLKAIYKLEYEVYIDDGDDGSSNSSEFNQRNIYGGLQGNFGTVIAGKNDTPLKLAQGDVDQFNDMPLGDIKNIMVGENRESNIIMYTTPSFSGFALSLSAMPGEEDGTGSDDDDGLADSTSVALTYTADMFYVALANDSNVDQQDITRLVGMMTLGRFEIGAIYQTAEESDDGDDLNDSSSQIEDFSGTGSDDFEEQDAWLLSGAFALNDKTKLKAQYGYAESTPQQTGLDDVESTLMAIGVDYKLQKNMKVFAYYSTIEAEGDSAVSNDDTEDKTFAVGWELKF